MSKLKELENSARIFLRSAYVPDAHRPVYDPGGPSMTRQEFAQECDVNEIIRKNPNVGMVPPLPGVSPQYYDFTEMPSNLQDSLNLMMDAEEAFMRLPALARKEFDNDPLRFIEFASSRDNLPKMREWGLADPEKVEPAPQKVEVVNPPAPAGKPTQ